MPFVRERPVVGAQVNVTGTVNVFEAAKAAGLRTTIAYASSAAVYDEEGQVAPKTLYGVFKLANEGTARIYADESGIASIGLRPFRSTARAATRASPPPRRWRSRPRSAASRTASRSAAERSFTTRATSPVRSSRRRAPS